MGFKQQTRQVVMNPFLWFQRLFVPPEESDNPNEVPPLEDDTPFVFSQHLRIVLAIAVSIIAALVLWWIMV